MAETKFLFVTTNRLLANVSRKYLCNERQLTWASCPPVLHVGQVTTIAWLLKDKALDPGKASRELLENCYAAIRPDAEWLKSFKTAIEERVGSLEEYEGNAHNAMVVQAARRIAQDASFGSSALLRQLSVAEILGKAEEVVKLHDAEREKSFQTTLSETVDRERKAASTEEGALWKSRMVERAERLAKITWRILEAAVLVIVTIFLADSYLHFLSVNLGLIGSVLLTIVGALSVLDLFFDTPIRQFSRLPVVWIAKFYYGNIMGGDIRDFPKSDI